MTYEEMGSGGGEACGCAAVVVFYPRVTAFGIGDTLYNAAKARRGVFEKVVVKSIRTILTRRTLAAGKTLYVDTLNGLWNVGSRLIRRGNRLGGVVSAEGVGRRK